MNNILFRFTIGSSNNNVLKLAEPGAPSFEERLSALQYAYENDFKTSVSVEPLLGGLTQLNELLFHITDYVSDSIWIGKMNKIDERVKIDYSTKTGAEIKKFISWIKEMQTDEGILYIYEYHKNNQKILWKDSIKEVIDKTFKN